MIAVTVKGAITGTYAQTYAFDKIGNLTNKSNLGNYTYGTKPHAVTNAGNNQYTYDGNGNMILRAELSGTQRITYTQQWDGENRLTVVTNTAVTPNAISKFIYDGDPTPLRCGDFAATVCCKWSWAAPHLTHAGCRG